MENNERIEKKQNDHQILINNRKAITLTGIDKVESASEAEVRLLVAGEALTISGEKLEVKKIDAEKGLVEIEGQITGLKYNNGKKKTSMLKRLFK